VTAARLIPLPEGFGGSPFKLPCETVSVVVIGRNEGKRLTKCLEAVNRMRYPATLLEKIYVDSESNDRSVEQAAEAGFKVLSYRAAFRTAAGARDLGWRASGSDLVLFLDGDCAVDPDFLRHAVSCILDKRVSAICGRIREVRANSCAKRRTLALHWEINRTAQPGWSYYTGGCALVKRTALVEVGGFNVELAATENTDLGWRLTKSAGGVWFVDRTIADHDSGVQSWSELFRRNIRNGYWFERYNADRRPTTETDAPAEMRTSAGWKAAPGLAAVLFGAALAGPGGATFGLGAAAAASLWKRMRKIRRVRGTSADVTDGLLLAYYDFTVWCGGLRYLAERAVGIPGAFQTSADWRSTGEGSAP